MSHFSVLVVGDNVEEQLAPYQENNMDNCPKQYLEFEDVENKYQEQYQTGDTRRLKDPTGKLHSPYKQQFRLGGECIVPPGYTEVHVSFKEMYATFEEYMDDYHGFKKRDPETGRYGYWENPNAKWDWYLIGGRWTGFFKLKRNPDGSYLEHKVGKPGLMTKSAKKGYADQVRKQDIDFEGMRNEAEVQARERWNEFRALVGGAVAEEFKPWSYYLNKHKDQIHQARNEYGAQALVKTLQSSTHPNKWDFHQDVEEYLLTEDQYALKARKRAARTLAVIMDGKWCVERGTMGWWGVIHDEKDEDEWNEQFSKLLNSVPDDTLLTIVDCHI